MGCQRDEIFDRYANCFAIFERENDDEPSIFGVLLFTQDPHLQLSKADNDDIIMMYMWGFSSRKLDSNTKEKLELAIPPN